MKSIQAQYIDLLEGKMSKVNFMRNLRMTYPQFVTPTLSYDDSIRVLKGKRMLSEAPEGVYGHNPNAETPPKPGIDQLNYYQVYHGIQYELAQVPEITDEAYVKARKKVVDTILKDPDAYKDLQLANFKAVKKLDKDLEMKDVKEDNKVDKANGMKVLRKDAPASANTTKKDAKNKSSIQQMTQTPKKHKGIEVMDVPGKATMLALKEHILDEMMKDNPEHEQINVGSRVKKKDVKDYDAAKVGNVTDFDGHMAVVKWDSGSEEHVMPNVLTKKQIPQHPEAREKFGALPNMGTVKGPDTGLNPKVSQMQENVEEEPKSKEDRLTRIKKLKERVIAKMNKEGFVAKTKLTGVTLASGKDLAKGTQAAKGLEKATGDQITVVDTRTGAEKDV